jgi:hypothetical protein
MITGRGKSKKLRQKHVAVSVKPLGVSEEVTAPQTLRWSLADVLQFCGDWRYKRFGQASLESTSTP